MEVARLGSLTDLYIAGVLNADEREELYWLLLSSPSARERFDRQIAGHRVQVPDAPLLTATEFLERYVAGAKIIPLSVIANQRRRFGGARILQASPWAYWSVGGALAACVVGALILVVQHNLRARPLFEVPGQLGSGPVAKLEHAANVQWMSTTNEVFVGDSFGAEELKLAAGVLQLGFKRGARLVVEGPARLQLVSDNEAFLHSGKVTAYVPDEAHGFKVSTPTLAAIDLGTEFGLTAGPKGSADLHVFSGVVEMGQPAREPRRMSEGQAARVSGRSTRKIALDRSAFLFQEEVEALEREEQRSRFEQWKGAARALSADPATVIHYTFEGQDELSLQLSNAAATARRGTVGTVSGTWDNGRWPDKRAITFASKADRIRFNVPNTLTSLTYMAWLRVDKLTSVSNALAITESMQLGEVHWQIYRDGRVALSAHSGSTGNVDQTWDRGLSPVIFSDDRLGQWTHLVSVYDSAARTISHYVNGEFVSETPIKRPLPLKLGAVEIGNWGVRVDQPKWASLKTSGPDYLNRHWSGRLDEFALLARAMSNDEIREYYRRGRVAIGMIVTQNAR